jgi:hypothetical protein
MLDDYDIFYQDNILFGLPYNRDRYEKGIFDCIHCSALTNEVLVIYQCALTQDLRRLETGDETEIGEKGLTLR